MIKITKKEMEYLVNNKVRYGENGISVTHSNSGKTWYMSETKKNVDLLNNYRQSIIC